MDIEKVSFYRPNTSYFKSGDPSTSTAMSMISLPRVRFLETDGPYRPKWAIDYDPNEIVQEAVQRVSRYAERHRHGKNLGDKITNLEQELADYVAQGLSVDEIHDKTKRTRSTIVSTLNRYKRKMALMKNEE